MVSALTEVRSRWLAGLTVLALVVLGGIIAQSASASSIGWQLNSKPLKEAVGVTSKGMLKFSDKRGGFFGEKVSIECKVAGEGSAGSGATGAVTKWTATGCATRLGLCPAPTIVIQALPWQAELIKTEGKIRDVLATSGKGAPAYQVECEGLVEDKCSGTTSTAIENVSGGVDAVFDSKSAKLTCTRGGAGEGAIEGTELIENPAGSTLTVGEGAEGWFVNGVLVTGTQAATSSGTLMFINAHGGPLGEEVEIKCGASGKGVVGPGVAGEVAEWKATSCSTSVGTCPTPTVKALDLPWKTELVITEGKVRDLITNGGKGTPEYQVTCAGEPEYKCSWAPSVVMENVSEGVDAFFDALGLSCTRGGSGSMEGSELFKEAAGHVLTVK